jgi:hypothetical protein
VPSLWSAPKTHKFPRPEVETMKKNDLSEATSNVLIFSSVSVALVPFLLGDRLVPIVTGLMRDGGSMITHLGDYVRWLFT